MAYETRMRISLDVPTQELVVERNYELNWCRIIMKYKDKPDSEFISFLSFTDSEARNLYAVLKKMYE